MALHNYNSLQLSQSSRVTEDFQMTWKKLTIHACRMATAEQTDCTYAVILLFSTQKKYYVGKNHFNLKLNREKDQPSIFFAWRYNVLHLVVLNVQFHNSVRIFTDIISHYILHTWYFQGVSNRTQTRCC